MTDHHLSIDELADLDEGLLASDRISAVREHLTGCDECRGKADAITSTRSALSDLPPVAMPPEVRGRLDRALAEVRSADDVPAPRSVELTPVSDADPRVDDGPALDTGPVIDADLRSPEVMPAPGTVLRPRFGRPTMAASAAAAALVLALGAVVVAHYHHHSSSTPATTARGQAGLAGGASTANPELSQVQPSSVVKTSTGLEYTTANVTSRVQNVLAREPQTGLLTAPPTPTALSSVGGTTPSGGTSGSGGSATKAGGTTATGRKYATSSTDHAGSTPLPSALPANPVVRARPIPKLLQPLAGSQRRIIACAVTITGDPDAVPEHVDFARWTGGTFHKAPSAIFIFLGATPSTRAVYVTNPQCSGNDVIRDFTQVTLSD